MSFRPVQDRAAGLPPRAWTWGLALLIGALGLWLRLDQLTQQTLVDDEWHAVHQLLHASPRQFLLSMGQDDHSIPLTLYDWLLMQTVGLSEWGMRLPMLLAGLLSLAALPWALRGTLDRRVGLVFALLLAVSTLHVGYSRMARPYALTLLLTLIAFALLARAAAPQRLRWGPALAYALLCGLSVWLHAVTAPFVLAPLVAMTLAMAFRRSHGQGLRWRDLLLLAALTSLFIAGALAPPLLADTAALAAKAGRGLPTLSTLRGVWYVWLGTSSSVLVVLSLGLAALGAAATWRSGPVARWTLLGLALTALAIVIVRPAWVFNPLTFGRYLLPALPLLLLTVAAGVVRMADALVARLQWGANAHRMMPMALALPLAAGIWLQSPQPALVRTPNSHTLSYYWQFDFRPRHNPVVAVFDSVALSPFWSTLSSRPRASLTVAVAPYRFESPAWLGPLWERASHQRVVPAFVAGACAPPLWGEVPADARFAFRNGVHLALGRSVLARQVDMVAFDRQGMALTQDGRRRRLPECEAWLRQHLGPPTFEDGTVLVWPLREGGTP